MARKGKPKQDREPKRDERVTIEADSEDALRALVAKRPKPPKKQRTSGK